MIDLKLQKASIYYQKVIMEYHLRLQLNYLKTESFLIAQIELVKPSKF